MLNKIKTWYITQWQSVASSVVNWIGRQGWPVKDVVSNGKKLELQQLLTDNYYIILTRHNGYLATYAINFAHWVLSRFKHWGYYSHSLMNLEDKVDSIDSFRLVESTSSGNGVHYATFDQAFDPQITSIALLKPKCMDIRQWTRVLDKLKNDVGKPYDTLYNLADDQSISCVELVRNALSASPTYKQDFAHFEELISKYKNLDPEMFYICRDFEVVWEVRH